MEHWLTCLDVDVARGRFAVGRVDGTFVVADLASGRPLWIEAAHGDRVSSLLLVEDGARGSELWSAGCDGALLRFDLERRECMRRIATGHGRVFSLRAAGDALVTVGEDGLARLFERATGEETQRLEEKRFGAAVSVAITSGWIAIGYDSGHVGIWVPGAPGASIARAEWKYEGNFQPPGRGRVYAIACAPACNAVAVARDQSVTICEPGGWRKLAAFAIPLACNDLHFDSRGTTLIAACSDREVRLVEKRAGVGGRGGAWAQVPRWLGAGMRGAPWQQEMIFSGARFVGDDRILAVSFDGTVRLFAASGMGDDPLHVARFGSETPGGFGESAQAEMTRRAQQLAGALVAAAREPETDGARERRERDEAEQDRHAVLVIAAYHAARKRPDLPPGSPLRDLAALKGHLGARFDEVEIAWDATPPQVRFASRFALAVPADRKSEVAAVVARANALSHLEVWRSEPRLCAEQVVPLVDGVLWTRDAERALAIVTTTVARDERALRKAAGSAAAGA